MSGRSGNEPAEDEAGDRLVSVRRVDDEATALLLAEFLRDQGVEANVHSVRMPWLGGVELMQRGFWGHVEVLEKDADRARALIDDFYAAEPQAPGRATAKDKDKDKDDAEEDR